MLKTLSLNVRHRRMQCDNVKQTLDERQNLPSPYPSQKKGRADSLTISVIIHDHAPRNIVMLNSSTCLKPHAFSLFCRVREQTLQHLNDTPNVRKALQQQRSEGGELKSAMQRSTHKKTFCCIIASLTEFLCRQSQTRKNSKITDNARVPRGKQ